MTDVREERCAELLPILSTMTPLLIEVQGNTAKAEELLPLIAQLRAVAGKGSDGVDDASYRQWIASADRSLDAMEEAVRDGDTKKAWELFADQSTGVNLLGQTCADCSGW